MRSIYNLIECIESLLDQFVTDECLNLLHKILISVCAQASKIGSSVSCKQSKFQQKVHSIRKMWMLDFEQKVSTDAEDSQVYL